jgi:hypothetical protein
VKQLAGENYQLREYIINLQSRLLESQGEVPELPANIDLTQSRTAEIALAAAGVQTTGSSSVPPSGPQQGQQQTSVTDDMNSLNRIAVAGLGMRKHPDEGNFLGNNFQQNKRVRTDDSQGDGSDPVGKPETHGLPMVN